MKMFSTHNAISGEPGDVDHRHSCANLKRALSQQRRSMWDTPTIVSSDRNLTAHVSFPLEGL